MRRSCVFVSGNQFDGILVSEMNDEEIRTMDNLQAAFIQSRGGVESYKIGTQLKQSLQDAGKKRCMRLSLALIELLSKYCSTDQSWNKCIDPARNLMLFFTCGYLVDRLLQENGKKEPEHESIISGLVQHIENSLSDAMIERIKSSSNKLAELTSIAKENPRWVAQFLEHCTN